MSDIVIPNLDFTIFGDGTYGINTEYCDCIVSKEQLKEFRNSIHNLLLDLNMELNYE